LAILVLTATYFFGVVVTKSFGSRFLGPENSRGRDGFRPLPLLAALRRDHLGRLGQFWGISPVCHLPTNLPVIEDDPNSSAQ